MRLSLFLILGVLLVLPGCGATQGQVDDQLRINVEKDQIAVRFMDQHDALARNAMKFADRNTTEGERTHKFFADSLTASSGNRDDYERLTRMQMRSVLAMKGLPAEDRERYMLELLGVIAAIKGEGGTPPPPATP